MPTNTQSNRLDAFRNVCLSINVSSALPEQVFKGDWGVFQFCESDAIFAADFVDAALMLLDRESANSCVIVNFSQTDILEYQTAAAIYIESGFQCDKYMSILVGSEIERGWLFDMDRYGITSDKGGWCMYCEKENDICVIAIRDQRDAVKFEVALNYLNARSLDYLLALGRNAPAPYSILTPEWKGALLSNYS